MSSTEWAYNQSSSVSGFRKSDKSKMTESPNILGSSASQWLC